jgi:hypothetical protein
VHRILRGALAFAFVAAAMPARPAEPPPAETEKAEEAGGGAAAPEPGGSFFVDVLLGVRRVEVRAADAEARAALEAAGGREDVQMLAFLRLDTTQYLDVGGTPGDHADDAALELRLGLTQLAFQGKNSDGSDKALDAADVINARSTLRLDVDFYWPLQPCLLDEPRAVLGGMGFGPVAWVGFSSDRDLDVASYEFLGLRVARDRWTRIDFLVGHHEGLPGARLLLQGEIELLQLGKETHVVFGGTGLFGEGNDDVSLFFGVTIAASDLLKRLPVVGEFLETGKGAP